MTDFLATMAVIKVNYDQRGHDVLQMLLPFVADRVRQYSSPLSDVQLQEDLANEFGLAVPRTVIKSLLRRLSRVGAVVRQHGVYIAVRDEIDKPEFDLSVAISEVRRGQAALLRDGVAFAKRVFDLEVTESDLSLALAGIVRDEVVPLTVWAVRGAVPSIERDVEGKLAHVAAQFILHVTSEGSAESQRALEQIAKGGLLSGVIWTVDIDAPDRRIAGLELFLDTTLLLRRLGLCGPVRQAYSEELTQLATASGVGLVCFEHNRTEIVGILSAAASILRSRRSRYYGEAVEFMVQEGWTPSDVEEVIASLDDRLLQIGVEVRRRPQRDPRYTMDEIRLRDLLDSHVHYSSTHALDADADSLASIFTMRKARHSEHFESSRAVFVTTNSNLALASRALYKIGEDQLRGIPLALIETQVASYMWARGGAAEENFSVNLMTMGAMSIAESEPKVWLKYVTKIDELREREALSERDYVLLRQSLVARSILLAVTDGEVDAFTEETADFVLRHALAENARELQEQLTEREGMIAQTEQALAAARSATDREREAAGALRKAHEDGFEQAARKAARRWVLFAGAALTLVALAGFIVSFPWPLDPPLSTALPAWAAIGIGVVAVVLATGSLLVGFTVRGVGSRVSDKLTSYLKRRYITRFGRP